MANSENQHISKSTETQKSFFVKTFKWMFLGLFITAITGILTVSLVPIEFFSTWLVWFFALAEFILVIVFSNKFSKVSSSKAAIMYIVLTVFNGIVFSSVFYCYNISQIGLAFGFAAILFGVMALYGYKTKKDLRKIGPYLLIGVIVCLISLIVNILLNNTIFDILISFAVIIIMCLLTAYDIHNMKYKELMKLDNSHLFFALKIYLDFLNIFLYILRLFNIKEE